MSGIALGPADVVVPAVTRRRVIAAVGAVGVAAAASTLPGRLAGRSAASPAELLMTASTFAALVGTVFALEVEGGEPVALTLVAVDGVGSTVASEDTFSLRLHGPVATRQGGQVGHLSASGVPRTPLLVVPSGPPRPDGQDWVVTIVRGTP
jgi:hypothetical protein